MTTSTGIAGIVDTFFFFSGIMLFPRITFKRSLAMKKIAGVMCALAVVFLVGCSCLQSSPPMDTKAPTSYKGEK